MIRAIDIVITATFASIIIRSWVAAVMATTANIIADKRADVSADARKEVHRIAGKLTLGAVGRTIWFGTLIVLVWVWA